jgi:hypothetical protein
VALFLQKNKNFYAHLEDIMLFRLSSEVIQQCQKQQSSELLEEHVLLSSDELLGDALNSRQDKLLTTEVGAVNNYVQNLSSEQYDINEEQECLDSVEDYKVLINQEPIKNTFFHDESSIQNQNPSLSNNAQDFEFNGGWQAICAFFDRIYNAIIRIIQQWISHINYSPQLFQPARKVHHTADLQATSFSCFEGTNSV